MDNPRGWRIVSDMPLHDHYDEDSNANTDLESDIADGFQTVDDLSDLEEARRALR